ncbi:hypothetical protein BOTCAL_0169g00030 [Botryotinia calthae]|uniref:Ig-like domain-containing protein n=1 Tax=Botryotinia calthae TaxID=38488 RepID=A0A4Y8D3N2_9HELO|nr:hypothetical protein BOTCAL_0169g00030 [Botryotinia calthae]
MHFSAQALLTTTLLSTLVFSLPVAAAASKETATFSAANAISAPVAHSAKTTPQFPIHSRTIALRCRLEISRMEVARRRRCAVRMRIVWGSRAGGRRLRMFSEFLGGCG